MATPSVLTTTVSGKLCTRSRRVTSSTNVVSTPAQALTSVISSAAASSTSSQIQPSALPAQQSAAAPVPPAAPTTAIGSEQAPNVAASSSPSLPSSSILLSQDPGTGSSVSAITSPLPSSSSQALDVPSVALLSDPAENSEPVAAPSSNVATSPTKPSVASNSVTINPVTFTTSSSLSTSSFTNSLKPTSMSTAGSAGVFAPIHGSGGSDSNNPPGSHTSQMNTRGVIGAVVGGLIGLAFIGALLFVCLRRRRTREALEAWKRKVNEKRRPERTPDQDPDPISFLGQIKVIAGSIGLLATALVSKISRKRSVAPEPNIRDSSRSSASSAYSTRSSARTRSTRFADRMAMIKNSKGLSGRQQQSANGPSTSPFSGVTEDSLDPEDLREPTIPRLRIVNPDPSQPNTPMLIPRQAMSEGLLDQQRPPLTPRTIQNPFSSPFDDSEERNGSATPEWFRSSSHKRTQSAVTALRSHPPSLLHASSFYYPSSSNPFADPLDIPMPSDPLPRWPTNAYTPQPLSDTYAPLSSRSPQVIPRNSGARRSSATNSRPTTAVTNASFSRATRGKSDPFDLDRPEVLGFGNVSSRKEVRASVTRQTSRSNRRSSTPNWVSLDDEMGVETRSSAIPVPMWTASVTEPGIAR
ncbi:hypothetical protein K432DRAFT_417008 [Lepidopterella palustris CBS 459.81]|uniref:Uncharacterized protein n=1 Tax=Lepidopterella palustris CBS 459.81 TaxID=1314670 RepID=A0A8E2EAD2_9PEZI|nr:hypothetical protein K432DRAFT_417008 [Lepidopterella palustris CBS 459.81]